MWLGHIDICWKRRVSEASIFLDLWMNVKKGILWKYRPYTIFYTMFKEFFHKIGKSIKNWENVLYTKYRLDDISGL